MKIGSNYNLLTDQKIKQADVKRQGEDINSAGDLSRKDMLVSYYPQDPYVGKPVTVSIPADGITAGPDNSRIDTKGDVKPNADGNMIFEPADPAFINVQVFTCVEKSIETTEKSRGKKVTFYGGRTKININPDKGEMRNAYYSRQDISLNFFHFKDKKTGQLIYTGKSAEIVNHEGHHAKLDGAKPGWLGWNQETMACHEARADIGAMSDALHDDNNIDLFLQQTGGDFNKPNIIASMGEEFGMSAYGRPYLRNAINDFTYSPPESLPEIPPSADQLGGEAHYFAPLFVGAYYDVLEKMFHSYEAAGMGQREALIKARDVSDVLMEKAVDIAPPYNATYKDLALSMIKADQMGEKGKHADILTGIFKDKRKIISDEDLPQLSMLEHTRGLIFLNSSSPSSIIDFIDKNREVFGIKEDIPLSLENVNKNEDGSENINVGFNVEVPLSGSDYGVFDGAVIDLQGGVNLGTKGTGLLASIGAGTVSDGDIEKTKNYMKKLIKDGKIKFVDPSKRSIKDEEFFDKDGKPYLGYTSYEDGKMKIVRSPIIV
jgi:hypothetical protein